VDIRSTVPTTGTYGDPSGYKILSGTSMATPHIAGAAALLLQWNAAQSPADLKSRLVASGRSLNTDPFKEGAGGVDLVKAFGLPALTNQTHLSFGVIEASSGTVVRERTLSLRNTAATSTTLSLSASPALPTGATLEILPSSLTLAAGQSADVTVRLTVDAAVLPTPPDPYIWSTRLSIAGGGQTATVPLYVFRGAVLALYFDETPWFIRLYTETGTSQNFNFQGGSLTTVVSPGTWDVQVAYHPPVALVVKEQQNVQTRLELSFVRGDATHAVTLLAIDDAGQSLREYSFRRELLYAPTASSFPDKVTELTTISSGDNFRVSPLSSRYLIGTTGAGPDAGGVRFFASDWAGQGLSSGVTLPFTGVPYRRLAQAALPPAGATQAFLQNGSGFVMKATWGGIGSLFSLAQAGELSRWIHIQSNVTPGVPMMPVYQSSLNSYAPNLSFIDWIDGTYYRQTTGENLEINRTAFFNFIDPSLQPETVLGAAVQRWDLDTPPHSLPIEFLNLPDAIGLNSGSGTWVTHTISSVYLRAGAEPTFDLYRNGALVGTYPFANINWGRMQTQAGPHELRATSAYTINGTAGSSQVVASFDTTKGDLNPPAVSKFRIEQNGIRTATPLYPANNATPHVKFRVTDPSPLTVTLEWRQNGTSTWTSLPLTQSQTDYDAALSQSGSIDLRVTATDSFGNKFEEVWTPAVITAAAAPPPTPAYVRATRAGTAAIGISWPPSESQSGISGYRIERLPDNKIVTTSGAGTTYTDTVQLVAGQSYFYRVSAIDVNNAVSAPTGYDVATLVELADEPVVPRVTPIRGTHIADLRRAVDAVRQATGLAKAWTNYNPPTGPVLASHFIELRDRLNEALSAMSLSLVNFTWYVAPGQVVYASSLQELRDGVK